MEWDLGIGGVALMAAASLGFGAVAQLVGGRHTHWWLGLIGTAVYFVAGLLISEVWFGWATEEDLQPNIDGLSVDEAMLIGLAPAIVAVVAAHRIARHRRRPGVDR